MSSLSSARSSWIARTACRSFAANVRSVRGSSSRATCMVMVEPPDTMRPFATSWSAARADRERIDAEVRAEALVFVGDQQIEIARIDILHGRRQAPAPVDPRVGAQQVPVAVDHHGGEFEVLAERHGTEGMDPCGEARSDERRRDAAAIAAMRSRRQRTRSVPSPLEGEGLGRGVDRDRSPHPPRCAQRPPPQGGRYERDVDRLAHFAASISTVPTPVRPKRSGRYMSST